ncbi:hypothetical protein ASG93_18165 [Paenibacillus sp. Soil787]|nr:hypothetical protein ASG93_18165 [Paenibacillus sp. Soil787]
MLGKLGMKGFAAVMSDHKRLTGVLKLGRIGQKAIVHGGVIKSKLGPLNAVAFIMVVALIVGANTFKCARVKELVISCIILRGGSYESTRH